MCWLNAIPPSPLQDNRHDCYKRRNQLLVCSASSLQWLLREYNSPLWGKLYSEWHLTLHRQGQRAVILHCFHLADSLTSLQGVGQTSETRASPMRRARQRSASRSAASCHRPMSLCCQHIQLQGAMWHVWMQAQKEDIYRDMWASPRCVPELTVTHISVSSLKKAWRSRKVWTGAEDIKQESAALHGRTT